MRKIVITSRQRTYLSKYTKHDIYTFDKLGICGNIGKNKMRDSGNDNEINLNVFSYKETV